MQTQWPDSNLVDSSFGPDGPAPDDLVSPSEVYHEASKLRLPDRPLYAWIAHVNTSPEVRQTISRPLTHLRGAPTVELPRVAPTTARSFRSILEGRRSGRDYSGVPIGLEALGSLLYLGDGIVVRMDMGGGATWGLRTAPSGGGLYPIELYCIVLNALGVPPGVYLYAASTHRLECVRAGDVTEELVDAVPAQAEMVRSAGVCIVMSAVMPRIKFKYGERGYRFALLEAGHIAQNLLLAAEAQGLSGVAIGGFMDDPLNRLLGLDGVDEAALYAVMVGTPSPT
ncbi:MAG: SagB/ThcOx family dehydrogenase [Armatimonadetes bacterium]|nr:SagB/ThcOx family dehydrogenase [Armatimonadota bacterium]